ncbi:uncharacterized protein LOC106166216 isoform X2 [Lingula anatina]|uniref:Uncharacterized protein LOC106166216 isoform X2 n=1 Tax=Lingula anatina TaxID=7574 RepID=A0A1S3IPL3_LINAN|nr:uncharacterized protein LOC106166216 isoform X2 [Lingula anatina]|eukprot:XP_013400152.1 uncharacterized protein LOC106166216 isoform X2 [Lingula anatina]
MPVKLRLNSAPVGVSPFHSAPSTPFHSLDETSCGPLCQHPMCWASQRRLERGLPRAAEKRKAKSDSGEEEKEEEEGGLPTLKVRNILDEYGDDSAEKFPFSWQVKEPQSRSTMLPSLMNREKSFPQTKVPQATPASSQRSPSRRVLPPRVNHVEVQEMFEPTDLSAEWQETFLPRQHYVWVPNPSSKKETKKKHLDPKEEVQIKDLNKGPVPLSARDVTEDLLPREIELLREAEAARKVQMSPRSTKSPTGGQPYKQHLMSGMKKKGDMEMLLELLHLPTKVLEKILEDNEDTKSLLSKEKIRDLLLTLVPSLPKDKVSLTLANSDVLQQKKLNLRDIREKNMKNPDLLTTKQVYLLDDYAVLEKMSSVNNPESEADEDRIARMSDFGSVREIPSARAESPKYIRKPLPSATGSKSTRTHKTKLPSISLGLPELPKGTIKPFMYSRQNFDFTLGPLPTPPPSESSSVAESRAPPSEGSTIHVTMPSVDSVMDSSLEAEGSSSREESVTPTAMQLQQELLSCYNSLVPQSAPYPKTPPTTRMTLRAQVSGTPPDTTTSSEEPEWGAAQDKATASAERQRAGKSNEPEPPEQGKESPIPPGSASLKAGRMSKRSVRFAPEVPSASREGSAKTQSTVTSSRRPGGQWGNKSPISITIPHLPMDYGESSLNTLMVTGARSIQTDISSVHRTGTPDYSEGQSPPPSPEPWPQVNEEDYEGSPTPPPPPSSSKPSSSANTDSRYVNIDSKSEKSSLSSMMKPPEHLVDKDKMMEDSPAPPPPSPEAVDRGSVSPKTTIMRNMSGSSGKDALSMTPLPEEMSDDEMTISAMPPSHFTYDRETTPIPSPPPTAPGEKDGEMAPPAEEKNDTIAKSSPLPSKSQTSDPEPPVVPHMSPQPEEQESSPAGTTGANHTTTFQTVDIPGGEINPTAKEERNSGEEFETGIDENLMERLAELDINQYGDDGEEFKDELMDELSKLS